MADSKPSLGQVRSLALAVAALVSVGAARAQEAEPAADQPPEGIEEIVTIGRFRSAAEELTAERFEVPFSADFLGAETIARTGDSDIAAALRRVPGLTLVDGKYVYVRGLGERYSSVVVNGAAVPSPDLTRSVIPLDLFPTSIVESIKIQKSPSPDALAAFGGGMVDIRTTSVPRGPVTQFSLGLGFNDVSEGDGLAYSGGATPMPQPIQDAIGAYRGDISITNMFNTMRAASPSATITDARVAHQALLDSLDTRIGIRPTSLDPDLDAKMALGNTWDLNDNWSFGVLFNATYNEKYRNENQFREGIGNPDTNTLDIDKSVYEERTVGALNMGLRFIEEHEIEVSHYVLQNDEDEASISRGFDSNYVFPDQKISYVTRLEQRELEVTQISGSHTFFDTPFVTSFLDKRGWGGLDFDWFFSESTATTDIPNESRFQASALFDPSTGEEISTQLLATTSSGQLSFLDLEDRMDSWGGNLSLPLELERMQLTLSGGWWGSQKARDYEQYVVNLNSVGVQSSVLAGDPGDVLVPGNLTVANGFNLSLGSNFGTESYLAAQKVDSGYGMVDVDFAESWRFTVGARWEAYEQTVLPIDLLDFTGISILTLQTALLDPNQRLAVQEDDVYGSAALTFNGTGALGSDDYQLRLSLGQTVVRPDLREIADVVYLDPELDVRVQGNPSLESSPIDNLELRSEFYYSGGDNFTIALFYKDIDSPIEQIRLPGSDEDFMLGFENAQAGEVYGVELEGLKMLPRGLFLAGNMTISDSEISLDPNLATTLTNPTRRMTGHSEWMLNATLGYDSDNGRHSAYLNYNAFGERIYFAGTGQNQDAYEQPFHSLGVVYKYFPTDRIQIEFKVDNILDEKREFEQINANGQVAHILSQDVGTSFGVGARWGF